MVATFEFATAGRISFGAGVRHQLGQVVADLGRRALFVTGSRPERYAALHEALVDAGVAVDTVSVAGEPTVEAIEAAVERARAFACAVVVGVGGGSPLDAAKAIAGLAANPGDAMDYLEVVGRGRPLARPALPVVAIPTTAGTGSEVTRNAVLKSTAHRVKVSLRHASMLPRVTLVDPELTLSLPPQVTADCGLDALTQVIEPYVSVAANPMTDAFCRTGIVHAARSLRRAYTHGDDLAARTDMAFASLCGGLALANAKLGAVHGFAGPLGGLLDAPHGALCARLLPGVIEANVRALEGRGPIVERYAEIARLVTGRSEARLEDGLAWIRALCDDLGVRSLSAYGMTAAEIPQIVEHSARASSMKGNPVVLPAAVLAAILRDAL